ncbi:hypothetical protein AcW1_010234 [Taiwanofungus camphoratus]|nr:hypothetical protein AcV5_003119 [Antrodia cinnamomea]KAI0946912.1 hypothetical protein AcW1_010234 [Antrodia cinnamomea]
MFGEHESESPRVPSPWDPFLPSPPSKSASPEAKNHLQNGIPKLVPEAEEGNVEYKLKLTHISPSRFARLVTQLKWRLLEGGGQAYYELGVADSGALIGLARTDLEESLETLEMMAGEIGASVIVVKEIEVPPAMYTLADEVSKYIDPDTGEWTRKMRRKVAPYSEEDSTTTTTEAETELSTTDLTDFDDTPSVSNLHTPKDSVNALQYPIYPKAYSHRPFHTHPSRPASQSSPFIAPLDDDLALFSMEPEPPISIKGDDEAEVVVDASPFSIDLEISSVYKPRPVRQRVRTSATDTSAAPVHMQGRHGRRQKVKDKEKKSQPWHTWSTGQESRHGESQKEASPIPNRQETKAAQRRLARDRRREEKQKALLVGSGLAAKDELNPSPVGAGTTDNLSISNGKDGVCPVAVPAVVSVNATAEETVELVSGLEALHVAVQTSVAIAVVPAPIVQTSAGEDSGSEQRQVGQAKGEEKEREPRLIVEALIVRKMSIEEAFLDFGGFSLV